MSKDTKQEQAGVTSLGGLTRFDIIPDEGAESTIGPEVDGRYFLAADVERLLAAPSQGEWQVGCERDDGLLNIHAESESCEVCRPIPPSTAPAPDARQSVNPQTDEILALHRQLAAEKLRANQGWERAEAKSKECIDLRERMAAQAAPSAPTDSEIDALWREATAGNHGDTTQAFVRWFARELLASKAAPSAPIGHVVVWNKGGSGEHKSLEPIGKSGCNLAESLPEGALVYLAVPSAKAEPVAYMVRREVDGHVFGTYQQSVEAERVKSWSEDAIVIPLYTAPAPAVQAETVAWMNPETLDVIHDARKRAWENDFGMGGKAKAAGYTCPLAAPAVRDEDVRNQARPELTVWHGPMPESNGRQNYTAVLHRKDSKGFDRFTDGFQFARSEYPDRVQYEVDFMRWLIGERESKPDLWDECYDMEKHSGYVAPSTSQTSEGADHE